MSLQRAANGVATGARFRVGVDIGGTFTDLILIDEHTGSLTIGKTLTTPSGPADAVARVLGEVAADNGPVSGVEVTTPGSCRVCTTD